MALACGVSGSESETLRVYLRVYGQASQQVSFPTVASWGISQ
jgi:hypothetical protein